MVSTIGGVFLGLTVGCAKCHDHKFDPITQRDYYRMRALVAGVQHGEQEIPPPDYPEKLKEAEAARADLRGIETRLLRFVPKARLDGDADNPSRPPVSPGMNLDRFDPVEARFVRFTILETNSSEPCIDELEIFSTGPDSVNVALADLGAKATASSEYPNNAKHKIVHLNDGEYGNDHSWIPASGPVAWAEIEFPEATTIDRIMWARDRDGAFSDRLATEVSDRSCGRTRPMESGRHFGRSARVQSGCGRGAPVLVRRHGRGRDPRIEWIAPQRTQAQEIN